MSRYVGNPLQNRNGSPSIHLREVHTCRPTWFPQLVCECTFGPSSPAFWWAVWHAALFSWASIPGAAILQLQDPIPSLFQGRQLNSFYPGAGARSKKLCLAAKISSWHASLRSSVEWFQWMLGDRFVPFELRRDWHYVWPAKCALVLGLSMAKIFFFKMFFHIIQKISTFFKSIFLCPFGSATS